jgi:hypothetical protein
VTQNLGLVFALCLPLAVGASPVKSKSRKIEQTRPAAPLTMTPAQDVAPAWSPAPIVDPPGRRQIRLATALFVAGGLLGDVGAGALAGIGAAYKQPAPAYTGVAFALLGIGFKIAAAILLDRGIRRNTRPLPVAVEMSRQALLW